MSRTKTILGMFALGLAASALALALAPTAAYAIEPIKVYRLYNHRSSEHLYTTNKLEYDQLPIITNGDWIQEGVAWGAPESSKSPVYRLYNPGLGDHHYTMSAKEANVLCARHGWRREGIAFYSDDGRRVPLFRLYNGGLRRGQHHYTASANERDVLSSRHGWKREGTGFYAGGRWVVNSAAWDEPVYEQVWVQDSAAWDEPVYSSKSYFLVTDGSRFETEQEAIAYLKSVYKETGSMLSWSVKYEQVQTGTIHHEATGHYEKILSGTVHHDEVGHWE